MKFKNNLVLKNVLCVPSFKHNLLYVQKLVEDSKCKVNFQPEFCLIQDIETSMVRAVGKASNGLYYLVNEEVGKLLNMLHKKKVKEGDNNSAKAALNVKVNIPDVI